MSVTDSTTTSELVDRAKKITERELAVYKERTRGSQAATERARKVLPAGVPSSFQAYDPHPIVVKHASGSRMVDVDDNEYVDYDMGFGALFAGHMHPAVRRAVEAQLDHGTLYVTPCELDAEVAELLGDRYGLPDVASHQLRHRSHDGRHPARPGCHQAGEARQGRGRLPRPPRRGDDLRQAGTRGRRPRRCAMVGAAVGGYHAGHDRRRDRHPVQRRRRRSSGHWRAARSPVSSWNR